MHARYLKPNPDRFKWVSRQCSGCKAYVFFEWNHAFSFRPPKGGTPAPTQTEYDLMIRLTPANQTILFIGLCWVIWNAASVLADTPVVPSVSGDHAAEMTAGTKLFRDHVRSILVDKCVDCHGGNSIESGFNITTRESMLRGGDSGTPAVVPRNAKASLLYRLITHEEEPTMPLEASKLKPQEIAIIGQWIDLGAPYDKSLIEERDTTPWTERVVPEAAKRYWAFQPLQNVSPPIVEGNSSSNPVDAFVIAKRSSAGISGNRPADNRTLLRRAYFGLVGMPPTPDEAKRFLDDPSPDAYEKMVDRLLGSPHFGQRWARHWLDVARFAESHGFEQDYDRPHAYHYRDFVIKAFNEDMPYNRFVRYQIAGDEIAPHDPLAMKATGFLGAGAYPTQITLREVEPSRYDAMDDMANTTGQAFLAMTIGCARCHDHKFDPIPQADYYRFVSNFVTTVRSNVEVEIAPVTPEEIDHYEAKTNQLTAQLTAFESEELPRLLDKWIKQSAPEAFNPSGWQVLNWNAKSQGGATFEPLEDGSYLAGGKNDQYDEYTFTTQTDLLGLSQLRIEALTHASMKHNGPGRAGNGNFALTDIRVTASSLADASQVIDVKLMNPQATHQQNDTNLSVAASIDDNPSSGWAVDLGGIGKDQAAAFQFDKPIGFASGTQLTVKLVFRGNVHHNLGRVRLAVANESEPVDLMSAANETVPSGLLSGVDLNLGLAAISDEEREPLFAWYRQREPRWRELKQSLDQHLASPPQPKTETVMVTSEGFPPIRHHMPAGAPDFFESTHFLRRGDVLQKDGEASPGVLQVLSSKSDDRDGWYIERPADARTSNRRSAVADWITDRDQGAGDLLARVIVNRLWHHHFNAGLVPTPNDFGKQAEAPSHPELLDHLAGELIRNDWRLKPIHKLILTSDTYRQSSAFNEASFAADNDNRLLWRFEPKRLEAEAIRDTMLAVTGTLDPRMFGPGTLDESMRRRSIYFMMKRSKLIPTLQLFDAPESLVPIGERAATTVGPQALWFLNNPHVRTWAEAFAGRLLPQLKESTDQTVDEVYWTAFSRTPDDFERKVASEFLAEQIVSYRTSGEKDAEKLALTDFCQSILSLNELIYVE